MPHAPTTSPSRGVCLTLRRQHRRLSSLKQRQRRSRAHAVAAVSSWSKPSSARRNAAQLHLCGATHHEHGSNSPASLAFKKRATFVRSTRTLCAYGRAPQSAPASPYNDDLRAIASNSARAQRHSTGIRVTADTKARAQIPIALSAASRGSAIELSTTPALSGADRFARGRAS